MLDIESLALSFTLCTRFAAVLLAGLLLTWQQPVADAHKPTAQEAGSPQDAAASATDPHVGPFVYLARPGAPPVLFPRAETLEYEATLDVSIFSANVGSVTQTCTVAEPPPPLLVTGPVQPQGEVASMKLFAHGSYAGYKLDSTLETRVLPPEWPRVVYTQTSKGSDGRRREVQLGRKDGVPTSSYRGDTKKGAPEGQRIWREPTLRQVPEGTFDMLTGVLLARTLIREDRQSITFPLIDKDRLWQLTLQRGKEDRMETAGAGTFDVVEVVLDPKPFPGEAFDEGNVKNFEGVFGIHGSIHLWVEKHSGVAVRIQGDIPVDVKIGTITLGIDVLLKSYSGTPPEFQPVK